MVIRGKKPPLRAGITRTKIHFAFFPVQLENRTDAGHGELIWWEKYIVTKRLEKPYPYTYPKRFKWEFVKSERLSAVFISHVE